LYLAKVEDALSAASSLLDWMSTYGAPTTWLSDQSPAFKNEMLTVFAERMGIQHHMVTAHSSQANGKQERLNRTLADFFRTLLSDNSLPETFWCHLVPLVQLMVNATPARSLGWLSPMQAFLNLQPVRPINFFLDGNKAWHEIDITATELGNLITAFHTETRAREVKLHQLQEQRSSALRISHERKNKPKSLNAVVGDFVLVRNFKEPLGKLDRRWIGPARITGFKDAKKAVEVEYLGERGKRHKKQTVHEKDVRLFDTADMMITDEINHHATMTSDAKFRISKLRNLGYNKKGKNSGYQIEVLWQGDAEEHVGATSTSNRRCS
jgi:transposase InsO family protein